MQPDKKELKVYKRHKRIWTMARVLLGPAILHTFRCKSEMAENLPEPYIVLPNHCCDLDPALVGVSFKHQMYFVASEHVYRKGFVSKLLLYCFGPIAKIKGSSDKMMVLKVLKAIREKKNVCIFPEGDRTFNGRTGEISEAIGKLIRVSGANLVTYKITGGYFANPRWGYGIRKGKMTGRVENVYTKEQLSAMKPEEITKIIRDDLYENAYERQKKEQIAYKGKLLAEGMECALTVCPICKKIGVIATKGDEVFCKECGPLAKYNNKGFFEKKASYFGFDTVEDWDFWQEDFYSGLTVNSLYADEEPFFKDEKVILRTVSAEHEEQDLGTGVISLSRKYLCFKSDKTDLKIPVDRLPDMAMYGKKGLVFTDAENTHYEMQCERLINVRKYISVWKYLRKNEKEME